MNSGLSWGPGHGGFPSPVTLLTVCYHSSVVAQLASLVTSYPVADELSVKSRGKEYNLNKLYDLVKLSPDSKGLIFLPGKREEDGRQKKR